MWLSEYLALLECRWIPISSWKSPSCVEIVSPEPSSVSLSKVGHTDGRISASRSTARPSSTQTWVSSPNRSLSLSHPQNERRCRASRVRHHHIIGRAKGENYDKQPKRKTFDTGSTGDWTRVGSQQQRNGKISFRSTPLQILRRWQLLCQLPSADLATIRW